MRGQEDVSGFIAAFTGSQRYVMDYLLEEVLQKQSEEIRDFMSKTSILGRLSGPLCDAVTGHRDSQDLLMNLERSQLFIVPLDESRQWYRYEHLFADLLHHQLESICGVEEINDLQGRASRWYENNNLPDESIHHALAAQDWENSVRLIDEYSVKRLQRGECVTFLNWTRQLPEEVLLSHPPLCLGHAGAMSMAGSLDAAESILKKLEKTVRDDDSLVSRIATHRAHLAWRRYDHPLVEELAEKALSLLPQDELQGRTVLSSYLGYVYCMRGRYKEAEPLFSQAYEIQIRLENYFGASSALGGMMSIAWRKSKLRRVAEMAQQALEWAGQSPAAIVPHILLSHMHYEWNDLDEAAGRIQQAIEVGKLVGTMQARVMIQYYLARVRLAQDDYDGFMKALERADLEANDIVDHAAVHADLAAYHISFAIRQGDLATAEEWGIKLAMYADALSHEYRHFPLRLLIAQGNKSGALEKLQTLYDEAVKSGMYGLMIEYRIYQTLGAENEESAVVYLSEALATAEPEGYIRTFVDEGKLLKPLLEKALSGGVAPAYTRKLLTIIEAEERQKLRRKKAEGATTTYDSILSERELEVLRLMAAGLSNQQIADRLIISLSTAKNHVHNILEKLEAEGRTQAITLARELEII
jgi:LuxR family maltose regulon positive regulatory protein